MQNVINLEIYPKSRTGLKPEPRFRRGIPGRIHQTPYRRQRGIPARAYALETPTPLIPVVHRTMYTGPSPVAFPEAPIDGQPYARLDGDWSPVTSGDYVYIDCGYYD